MQSSRISLSINEQHEYVEAMYTHIWDVVAAVLARANYNYTGTKRTFILVHLHMKRAGAVAIDE